MGGVQVELQHTALSCNSVWPQFRDWAELPARIRAGSRTLVLLILCSRSSRPLRQLASVGVREVTSAQSKCKVVRHQPRSGRLTGELGLVALQRHQHRHPDCHWRQKGILS